MVPPGPEKRRKEEQEMKTGTRLNDGMRDFLTPPYVDIKEEFERVHPYRSPAMTATERW